MSNLQEMWQEIIKRFEETSPDVETRRKWVEDVLAAITEYTRDSMCYGCGALRVIDSYPYIGSVPLEELQDVDFRDFIEFSDHADS